MLDEFESTYFGRVLVFCERMYLKGTFDLCGARIQQRLHV